MLTIVIITLISVYLSLVIGTVKKFETNGIDFSFFAKILSFLLPGAILIFHLKMAVDNLRNDKHISLELIKMGTLNYPVAVGVLVEVALEQFAHRTVFGNSLNHIKKTPIKINAVTVTKQRSSVFNLYGKTTVNLAEC